MDGQGQGPGCDMHALASAARAVVCQSTGAPSLRNPMAVLCALVRCVVPSAVPEQPDAVAICVPAGFPPCSEPGRRVYQVAPGPPMERNPCACSKLAVHAQAISGRYSALEGTREDMLFPGRRSGWRIRVDLVLDALTATGSRARPPGT